jgi:hypothetical protein
VIAMNHKRKKPKSGRAGCLLCKPHKRQGSCLHERAKPSDRVREMAAEEQVRSFRCDEA